MSALRALTAVVDTVGESATPTPTGSPVPSPAPTGGGAAANVVTLDSQQFAALIIGIGLVVLVLAFLAIKAK